VFTVFIYRKRKTVKNNMWWKGSPVTGFSMTNSTLFAQEPQVVLHPLKFPNLTTSRYFLFLKPKLVLKRKRIGNIIVIKEKL
jgi:hypothetical protein